MSSQPLYRIVYADGKTGSAVQWFLVLGMVRFFRHHWNPNARPVRVERVSPAPRATGGER